MPTKKTCTLIGSDKGGVGKSLIAQLIVMAYDKGNTPLTVIEIDNQRKLTSTLKNRVNLSLDAAPSIAAISKDRLAGESFFNRVYESWAVQDSLTDLGANVTTTLMEWARVNDAAALAEEDEILYRFVAVTTPDDQAIRSASVALETARRSLGADAELYVILNDNSQGSGFTPYENTQDWRHLMSLQRSLGVTLINVPLCDSVIMEWSKGFGFTILDILENGNREFERIQGQANFDRLTVRVHVRKLTEWLKRLQTELRPLFIPQRYASHYDVAAE